MKKIVLAVAASLIFSGTTLAEEVARANNSYDVISDKAEIMVRVENYGKGTYQEYKNISRVRVVPEKNFTILVIGSRTNIVSNELKFQIIEM